MLGSSSSDIYKKSFEGDKYLNIQKELVTPPPEFNEINKIRIKNDDLVQLRELYKENSKETQSYCIRNTNEEFSKKAQDFLYSIDHCMLDEFPLPYDLKKTKTKTLKNELKNLDISSSGSVSNSPFQKFSHYNLMDIEFDPVAAKASAFEFISNLNKNTQNSLENITIAPPTFIKDKNKMKEEKQVKTISNSFGLLSFQDDIDEEFN